MMTKKRIYDLLGVSGKSYERKRKHPSVIKERASTERVLVIARAVDNDYLLGSCSRELYKYIQEKLPDFKEELLGWPQRAFEKLCLDNGFRKVAKRFVPVTTEKGNFTYDNLIENTLVTDINQVWVCDMTYVFSASGKMIGYATSILDAYSRRLLALKFSDHMTAEETAISAIKQAMKERNMDYFPGLIFHTDGGKQFIEAKFKKLQKMAGITPSMAKCCYDNAQAESYNDTLKNHQLSTTTIVTLAQLKQMAGKLMKQYNENKPHTSLNRMTPNEFEKQLQGSLIGKFMPYEIQPSPLNRAKPSIVMILLSELELADKNGKAR
jgi:putative transposase